MKQELNEDFIHKLDNIEARADWGVELSESLDCRSLSDEKFIANRVENLVAGFSNRCNLDCAYCGVHRSKALNIPLKEFEVERLVQLVNNHKAETGEKIGHFRIGNTGEPLLHKDFRSLVEGTQDAVGYYSLISNLNIKDTSRIRFVAEHPQFEWVNVSCDAGDADTYARMRIGGDFNLVLKNARILGESGKRIVVNVVVFKENEQSLLQLPHLFRDMGVHEFHIFYPLNPTPILDAHGLHKQGLEAFVTFLKRMRATCEQYGMRLSSDSWAMRPELIGVLSDIENEKMYQMYTGSPCQALYHVILYPEGSYNNCSVLNRLGMVHVEKDRPVYNKELMEMLNTPTVLTFRKLQMMGYFAPPCKHICGKVDNPRSEQEAELILSMKYPKRDRTVDLKGFEQRLLAENRRFSVRALSPAMRNALEFYPSLADRLEMIIDRDESIRFNGVKVLPPEAVNTDGETEKPILLIASDREVVFNSVVSQAHHYQEIHKLMVNGANPKDFRVQQLCPW
jgi:molybdenum cofactor biosynthesis enzyme MoaA